MIQQQSGSIRIWGLPWTNAIATALGAVDLYLGGDSSPVFTGEGRPGSCGRPTLSQVGKGEASLLYMPTIRVHDIEKQSLLDQKETAERMGISSITVSRRLKKGLEALGQFMRGTDDRQ